MYIYIYVWPELFDGSEVRFQKAPAWYGKQTQKRECFWWFLSQNRIDLSQLLGRISSNILPTDFTTYLASLDLKRINNKTCSKSKGSVFLFASMRISWWILFTFQSAASFAPRGLCISCGGVLRLSEIPNPKKTQPSAPKVPKWQKQGLRLHSPQEFSHMAAVESKFPINSKALIIVQRWLKQIMWGQTPGKQKHVNVYICISCWFVYNSWNCMYGKAKMDINRLLVNCPPLLQGSMP